MNANGVDVPEIQVNEIKEDTKIKKNQSFELYEEIDEIGSFVEDNKILPEIIIKSNKVPIFKTYHCQLFVHLFKAHYTVLSKLL